MNLKNKMNFLYTNISFLRYFRTLGFPNTRTIDTSKLFAGFYISSSNNSSTQQHHTTDI